jgi:uncharacterized protein YxeA
MKKIIFTLLFLLMITGVSAIVVRFAPYEMAPGLNRASVYVINHGDTIKDAKISVNIPDLELRQQTQMNLKSGKVAKTNIGLDIPENAKGYYPVRVTISDKTGVQKKTHTWVYIE